MVAAYIQSWVGVSTPMPVSPVTVSTSGTAATAS